MGSWASRGLAAVCGGIMAGLVWMASDKGWAAADPAASVVGALVGTVGLVFALYSWRRGAWVPDVQAVAGRLAKQVVRLEQVEYRQLLGGDVSSLIDVEFTTRVHGRVDGVTEEGRVAGIAAYYRELRPGRMVITGTPGTAPDGPSGTGGDAGTGKSVALLVLLLGLARTRPADEPVPVRLSAAAWPGTSIDDWLYTHLTGTYRMRPRDARALLAAQMVLPVIDGLDETDGTSAPGYTSRAALLLKQVNTHQSGDRPGPVVLTCRHGHYLALTAVEVHAQAVAVVQLARVEAGRARAFLGQRVADTPAGRTRWDPVLNALDGTAGTSSALQHALDTPWRLSLAAVVFQERDPGGRYVRDPRRLLTLAEGSTLNEYLLDRYIAAALHTHAMDQRSRGPARDAETTWKYLAVLAAYLDANTSYRSLAGRTLSATDLVLHDLWPLTGPERTRRADRILTTVLLLVPVAAFAALVMVRSPWSMTAWIAGACVLLIPGWAVLRGEAWPTPSKVGVPRWRTLTGRREVAFRFKVLLASALLASPAAGLSLGLATGFLLGPGYGFRTGLRAALDIGLLIGLFGVLGIVLDASEQEPFTDPRQPVRRDRNSWLVLGIGFMLPIGLLEELTDVDGLAAMGRGLAIALLLTLILGPAFGLIGGLCGGVGGRAWVRYVAFRLCARGQLPWRLGDFLHHCYRMGILRIAGTAYQFRHRELQDHLATRPGQPPRG
ncbi:hypothetical protein AB0D94_11730 [Streptomyces sp. NPDC048255]|uniref:hypothetical protein n=1 Tax=Streptomyces sp. NPDC048255 TaxID=3154713 RepID=UPI0033D739A9